MGLLRLSHVRPEVTAEVTVAEAVRVMSEAEIGAIAVKDGRKIVGIFTERDVMKRVVAKGRDPTTTPLRDVMTTRLVSVADSTTVANAAAVMRSHRLRHLIVVDANGDYLGLVAQRHLLYEMLGELTTKVGDLTAYLMVDGPGG
jgi:CBS domain-containing protein